MNLQDATCPECQVGVGDNLLNAVDITTPDDKELGYVRLALRCQACGFATAFVAVVAQEKL